MYTGAGEWKQEGERMQKYYCFNLSFEIFELNFHADDLPECSATLCIPSGTEYWMKSQRTCSQIFISFGTL